MLIDCHVHCTKRKSVARRGGTHYPTGDELLEMMDAGGIDMALIMCGIGPECRNQFVSPEDVLEICALHPTRLIPSCCIDPRSGANSPDFDFSAFFEFYKNAGAKSIGELTSCLPWGDPRTRNLLRQAGEWEMPITFHIAPEPVGYYGLIDELGLPGLEKALQDFPDTIFFGHSQPFWAHVSGDVTEETWKGYPQGPVTPGGRIPELLERYPNLYGDLSAGSGHNAISRDEEFGFEFLERFQDRLFFGTDICYPGQELMQCEWFPANLEAGNIAPDVYEKITWRNIDRALGLGLA